MKQREYITLREFIDYLETEFSDQMDVEVKIDGYVFSCARFEPEWGEILVQLGQQKNAGAINLYPDRSCD